MEIKIRHTKSPLNPAITREWVVAIAIVLKPRGLRLVLRLVLFL